MDMDITDMQKFENFLRDLDFSIYIGHYYKNREWEIGLCFDNHNKVIAVNILNKETVEDYSMNVNLNYNNVIRHIKKVFKTPATNFNFELFYNKFYENET